MRPPSLPIAYLCLALSMVLVGSYVALSKPLVAVFPVLLLAWLRFAIGAVAMLHWLPAPAHEMPLSRRTHGLLFFEALIGNFLFTLCMVAGVSLTGAVAAGVVMAAIPAAVALLSWLVLKEHIGPRTWMAVALAVLGGGSAAAQEPVDILSVVGRPVLALAQRPELTTGLRFTSGGHRSALAARLRDPGPPVTLVAEHFLQGWACRPSGCRDGGVFGPSASMSA